ncbi:hypothetical protein L873DRAFT_810640 [Choiromyces venosus 120613-1]|uniref:Origin recognition complex subunit 1 n=1 Tax=Choiromyces venosus 120613-1 TaxID=1336337 RepID=A0A3N4JU73_9PEZI|nr:hypothetical protein L873DRAFT_810640 [Choiromyces venosus 120613-1]
MIVQLKRKNIGNSLLFTIKDLIFCPVFKLIQLTILSKLTFIEINGMKVTVPHQAYPLLCKAIKGDRVSPSQVLGFLESEFSTPCLRSAPCVVLMDEIDQLVTRSQDVMYNLFNWPGGRHSKLIVLAIANTMGLPERTPSNTISASLVSYTLPPPLSTARAIQLSLIIGFTRITFLGYTHFRLMTIILSCLRGYQVTLSTQKPPNSPVEKSPLSPARQDHWISAAEHLKSSNTLPTKIPTTTKPHHPPPDKKQFDIHIERHRQ